MEFDEKKLRITVEKELGDSFEWTSIEEGVNTVYKISSIDSKDEFIVKVHTNLKTGSNAYSSLNVQKNRFKAEAEIYNLLRKINDIPSPKVAYRDFSGENLSHLFYVMEKIEGVSGDKIKDKLNDEEIEKILFDYGKILGKIHNETRLEDYGLVLYRKNGLSTKNGKNDWETGFKSMIKNISRIIEKKLDEKPDLEISKILGKAKLVPKHPKPVLIHSDNRWENLIINNNSIEGFLDWSFTRTGDPYYDFVRAEYLLIDYSFDSERVENSNFRESLRDGYQKENYFPNMKEISDLRNLYRYTTILWILGGIPNWGSDWEDSYREKKKNELLDDLKSEKFWR